MLRTICAAAFLFALSPTANAQDIHGFGTVSISGHVKQAVAVHQRGRSVARHSGVRSVGKVLGLIRVSTAAGIDITVAPAFAHKIQGFIGDLVARGYSPSRIKCFSLSKSHVKNSNHFWGGACDFNQGGWNKTDRPMYRVADLARKWGLRDGCSFRDCGHIDMPRAYAHHSRTHYASAR